MVSINTNSKSNVDKGKVEARLIKAMESTLRSGENVASQEAPVDTGRLKNSIRIRRLDKFSWLLEAPVDYAASVEKGTEPHTITPTDADALYWEGADHPVMSVEHPGTNAQPFMGPAFDHMVKIAPKKFDLYMNK